MKGDQRAQKALIRLFIGFVKSISLRYVTNNDQTQPFKAWLRTIVVHTAIDYYRKAQKYQLQIDIDEVDAVDFNPDIISKISAEEILALIQKLPPAYRMVFTLYVVEGYNHREIADLLNIKEGTSKSNLQDARKKLQKMILVAYPYLYYTYELRNLRINDN